MQTVPLPAFSLLIYLFAACLLFFSALFDSLNHCTPHSLLCKNTVTPVTSPQTLPLNPVNHLFPALLLCDENLLLLLLYHAWHRSDFILHKVTFLPAPLCF